MTLYFPRALLRERASSWNLVGNVATPGGVTAASVATVVRSDGGGYWSCVMDSVSLSGLNGQDLIGRQRQRHATLLWRAVRQACDGGVNPIIVPCNDALFIPYPAGVERAITVPHSDDSPFSDDSEYYQAVIDISVDGDVALRATSMSVDINYAALLLGGERFSVAHDVMGWRLYEIATVEYDTDDHANITFMPPLREAVADGTMLEFDRPRCTMRLAKPGSMDLSIAPWTFNTASVDFVEAPIV